MPERRTYMFRYMFTHIRVKVNINQIPFQILNLASTNSILFNYIHITLELHSSNTSFHQLYNFLEDLPYFHIIIDTFQSRLFYFPTDPLRIFPFDHKHSSSIAISSIHPITDLNQIYLTCLESISNFESSISNTLPLQFPQLSNSIFDDPSLLHPHF